MLDKSRIACMADDPYGNCETAIKEVEDFVQAEANKESSFLIGPLVPLVLAKRCLSTLLG